MQAGTYALQVTSVDGDRISLAGTGSGSNYAAQAVGAASSTTTAAVSAGWNDVFFDITETGIDAPNVTVKVASGPELVNMPLPLDRLRSVEPGERVVGSAATNNVTLPNQNSVRINLPAMQALTAETVSSAVVRVNLVNPEYTGIGLTLKNPNGDTLTLDTSAPIILNGSATYYYLLTSSNAATLIANGQVAGTWQVGVSDSTNSPGNQGGTVNEVNLTLHTSAGPKHIATDSVWTSPVQGNGHQIVSVDAVTWTERSTVMPAKVRLRGCDAPCANEAWTDATNGAALPAVAGHVYLQAQVEMFSDGTTAPEFEQLQVMYKRNAN
jgi:hypothetical protein